jgi:RimJ/RimL family protein N-acetyltransferase
MSTESGKTTLQTERLILRSWRASDAESLYKYASDPRVGPIAGWPVHTSVENSREIIRNVLSEEGNFAVVLKETGETVGSVGLMTGGASNLELPEGDAEIGYWIGVPLWGRGLIPEAVRELIRYAFEERGIWTLWCGYFDGNDQSRRVSTKCGFRYIHSEANGWTIHKIERTLATSKSKQRVQEEWMVVNY